MAAVVHTRGPIEDEGASRSRPRPLLGGPAAVGHELRALHVGGGVRGEEHGQPAICSGVVNCSCGCFSASRCAAPARPGCPAPPARASICFCTSGVSTQPGQIALQVTPVSAHSMPTTLVRPDDAVLGRDVGDLLGRGDQAVRAGDVDDAAPACAFISGSASRMVWKAALRLMAMIASHFSGGKSSIGATCWMPALFTRMSTPPKAALWSRPPGRRSPPACSCRRRCTRPSRRLLGHVLAQSLDRGGIAEAVQHDVAALRRRTPRRWPGRCRSSSR